MNTVWLTVDVASREQFIQQFKNDGIELVWDEIIIHAADIEEQYFEVAVSNDQHQALKKDEEVNSISLYDNATLRSEID